MPPDCQPIRAGFRDGATPKTWMRTDLDANGEPDYVLAWAGRDYVSAIHVYTKADGGWDTAVLTPRSLPSGTDAAAMLREGEIRTVEPALRDLAVGELILSRQAGGAALDE